MPNLSPISFLSFLADAGVIEAEAMLAGLLPSGEYQIGCRDVVSHGQVAEAIVVRVNADGALVLQQFKNPTGPTWIAARDAVCLVA
jgi:hypothetical protein